MKKTILSLSFLFFIIISTVAQVAVNTTGAAANTNAMLDVQSNAKGMLLPRMTTVQRKAIAVTTADAGLLVYDTDRQIMYMYDGVDWLPFAVTANALDIIKKKMPAANAQSGNFGHAVAIDGNYAVVGAYWDSVGNNGYNQGSAYIYKKISGNWILQSRLLASDGAQGDEFGISVAIDGDYIAIGSIGAHNATNIESGAVYVFMRNGGNWVEQAKLTPNDGGAGYYFGRSLAIQGTTIIAGAPATKIGNNLKQGAAYVFTRTGTAWLQQTKLMDNVAGEADDRFGESVAVNNNDIVVGASHAKFEGAVYVYTKVANTYPFQAKLISSNPGNTGVFGCSVAIDNDAIIVGAYYDYYGGIRVGTAHLYKKAGTVWAFTQMFEPITASDEIWFGFDVAIKNDVIFISASMENIGDNKKQGSVYVYRSNGGSYRLEKRITDPDPSYGEQFGQSVDFDGNNFIIGSPSARRTVTGNTGVVHFGVID